MNILCTDKTGRLLTQDKNYLLQEALLDPYGFQESLGCTQNAYLNNSFTQTGLKKFYWMSRFLGSNQELKSLDIEKNWAPEIWMRFRLTLCIVGCLVTSKKWEKIKVDLQRCS
jgi:hypothetical protein